MYTMKRFAPSCRMIAVAWFLATLCAAADLHAAVIGSLRNVTGPVDVLRGGNLPAVAAKNGDPVSSGDLVRTKTGGFAEVVYQEGTVLRISQRSRVDIGEHFSGKSPNSSEVRLTRGKVRAIVDLKNVKSAGAKKFEVRTPNAIAGVRGTDWGVMHMRNTTTVMTFSGSVYTFNPLNPALIATLTAGTVSTVTGPAPPLSPRPATQQELQRMQQGTAPPSTGSGSSGGGPGGGAGTGAGGDGGATTGGTVTGGGPTTPGGTAGATTEGLGGGTTLFSPGVLLPTLPTTGTLGPTGGVSLNTLAQGAGQVLTQTTTTPQTTHTNSTAPVTSTTITPITPPTPTPTNVNVNVGIKF